MKSVQTRALRVPQWVVIALTALGISAALPNAQADLPKAGEYKGTLTVVKSVSGMTEGDPPAEIQTTFKAVAQVDAAGYVRVIYSGGFAALFGKFVESGSTLSVAVEEKNLVAESRPRGFVVQFDGSPRDRCRPGSANY